MLAFTAARLLTPTDTIEHPLLLVERERVLEVSIRRSRHVPDGLSVSDFGDGVMVPGYVDLHIHGSAGYDVMDDDDEALPAIERLLARHGVTSYFPTTVTAPINDTLRALERLADAIEKRESGSTPNTNNKEGKGRALPLGIHLEGPFLSHARRKIGVGMPEAHANAAPRGLGDNLGRALQFRSNRHHANAAAPRLPEPLEQSQRWRQQIFGWVHPAAGMTKEWPLKMDSQRKGPTFALLIISIWCAA